MAFWDFNKRKRELIKRCNEAAGILNLMENLDETNNVQKAATGLTLARIATDVDFEASFTPTIPAMYEKIDTLSLGVNSRKQNLFLYSHFIHHIILHLLAIKALSPEFISTQNRASILSHIDMDISSFRELLPVLWKYYDSEENDYTRKQSVL